MFTLLCALLTQSPAVAADKTVVIDLGSDTITLTVDEDGNILAGKYRRKMRPVQMLTEEQSARIMERSEASRGAPPPGWRPTAIEAEDIMPPPQRRPLTQTLTVDMPERDRATGLRAEHFAHCIEDGDFRRAELRLHHVSWNAWEHVPAWKPEEGWVRFPDGRCAQRVIAKHRQEHYTDAEWAQRPFRDRFLFTLSD